MTDVMTKMAVFTTGFVVGYIATRYFLKNKYEHIYRKEIETVKATLKSERFHNKLEEKLDSTKIENNVNEIKDSEEVKKCEKIISNNNYKNYSEIMTKPKKEEKGETTITNDIYIISPEEFGEKGYETVSLMYFSDNILTDDQYEIIENREEVIGEDSLLHFGDYEEDSVFVRNDNLEADYEILLDIRKYSEVVEE